MTMMGTGLACWPGPGHGRPASHDRACGRKGEHMPAHRRSRVPDEESRGQAAKRLIRAQNSIRELTRAGKAKEADRQEVRDAIDSYDRATRRERGR